VNRFFHREDFLRELPRRVFARLDDIEPIAPGPEDQLTFVLDAVDAYWKGFEEGGPFDLSDPNLKKRMAAYWRGQFGREGNNAPDESDGYEQVPIYRVEVSLSRGDAFFDRMPSNERGWISLELSKVESKTPVQVYGGIFAPPIHAFLHNATPSAPSGALSTVFDMKTWPDATPAALLLALRQRCDLESLVCFDIGQGSACALLCTHGYPIYYFDTGCGSGRNAPTAPPTLKFCTCASPTVILSHWDTDHWVAATGHAGLLASQWVVPRQTISSSHTSFANSILKAGGRIHVVGNGAAPLQWSGGGQDYDLQRATGTGRNDSGLVLIVTDAPSKRSWVLTGDAGYDFIAQSTPVGVAAMVVPHHGADMGAKSQPFVRGSKKYARLFYSFGPGNGHGSKKPPVCHPVTAAINAHQNKNWKHGAWTAAKAGHSVAGGDVIATASHVSKHLNGGAAGWTGKPKSLGHLATCPDAMPVTQT
jgi:beta-lactamase superfamily II metal-dependent hydrolase